jgi:hypothetical protein
VSQEIMSDRPLTAEEAAALVGVPVSEPAPVVFDPAPEPVPSAPVLAPTTPGAAYRIDLGSGEWADVRDPRSLVAKDRKDVVRRLTGDETGGGAVVSMVDGVIAMMVVGWSLPLPLPSEDFNVLDSLSLEADAALNDNEHIEAAAELLLRKRRSPAEVSADPASPTKPSGV